MARISDLVAKARETVGHIIRRVTADGAYPQPNRPNLDFAGNCTVQDTGDAIRVTVPDVPAGSITVGRTITTAPGTLADVRNFGTDIHATLEFSIPQGKDGEIYIDSVETLPSDVTAYVVNNGTPGTARLAIGLPQGKAASIEVGEVTTLEPGEPATVTNSGTGDEAVFDFGIPQGKRTSVTIGDVETLPAGSAAYVTNVGTIDDAVLNFGIPQGGLDPGSTVQVDKGGTGANTAEGARVNLDVPSNAELAAVGSKADANAVAIEQAFANIATNTSNIAANTASIATNTSDISSLQADIATRALDADVVKLSGAQTVAGVKTFSSSPVVPTPDATDDSTNAATTAWVRAYVDAKLAEIFYYAKDGTTV